MHLGFLTNDTAREQRFFTAAALEAAKLDITAVRFTPNDVDCVNQTIAGERFDAGAGIWIKTRFGVPDFIYDRSYHGLVREPGKRKETIQWLKEHSRFLGYGLPGKWEIYQALQKDNYLQAFLPPTVKLTSPEDAEALLQDYSEILIKPEFGSSGSGIFLITKKDGNFEAALEKEGSMYRRRFPSLKSFEKWLNQLIKKYKYLAQPYLQLQTEENRPFDIRVFLQQEETGWREFGRALRIGKKGGITANLAKGGNLSSYAKYSADLPIHKARQIELHIERMMETLPSALEKAFSPLFELGIDLGVDTSGRVWILDCNSKPGRKIIEKLYPEKMQAMYRAPGKYCNYLAAETSKAGLNHEKNISR